MSQYPIHAQVEGDDALWWLGGCRQYRETTQQQDESKAQQPAM
ncbi:hypothetical protein [Halopseudomonas bauzanensis]|nr:hypothetical protein [Halopseudomonas bauzanensis]